MTNTRSRAQIQADFERRRQQMVQKSRALQAQLDIAALWVPENAPLDEVQRALNQLRGPVIEERP